MNRERTWGNVRGWGGYRVEETIYGCREGVSGVAVRGLWRLTEWVVMESCGEFPRIVHLIWYNRLNHTRKCWNRKEHLIVVKPAFGSSGGRWKGRFRIRPLLYKKANNGAWLSWGGICAHWESSRVWGEVLGVIEEGYGVAGDDTFVRRRGLMRWRGSGSVKSHGLRKGLEGWRVEKRVCEWLWERDVRWTNGGVDISQSCGRPWVGVVLKKICGCCPVIRVGGGFRSTGDGRLG